MIDWWIIGCLVGLLLLEGLLRGLGIGNPLIYVADDDIGYLLKPHQHTRRLGKRIWINRYSMRSPDVDERRSPQTLRIFILGDSVANGGWWTDQADTISTVLQTRLTRPSSSASGHRVEVLNASANSWGPRNELAYLKRFGIFESQVVVLLLNTDDLFAMAPTPLPVGRDRNYPNRKPPLALVELVTRLMPSPANPDWKPLPEGGDRVGMNLTALEHMHTIVSQSGGQFMIVMTPLKRELQLSGSRDYEQKARDRLSTFTQQQCIPYLDLLPSFQNDHDHALYRDHIHLSLEGNRVVSEAIAIFLIPHLQQQNPL